MSYLYASTSFGFWLANRCCQLVLAVLRTISMFRSLILNYLISNLLYAIPVPADICGKSISLVNIWIASMYVSLLIAVAFTHSGGKWKCATKKLIPLRAAQFLYLKINNCDSFIITCRITNNYYSVRVCSCAKFIFVRFVCLWVVSVNSIAVMIYLRLYKVINTVNLPLAWSVVNEFLSDRLTPKSFWARPG